MPSGTSWGNTDSRRTAAPSVSRIDLNLFTARPPHTNSTRWPPLKRSTAPIAITPIEPVLATCVPPHADRSNPSMSISRSVPSRAVSFRSGNAAASLGADEANRDRMVFPDDAVGLGFGGGDVVAGQLAVEIDGG